jgi:FkbM family methyltransferase
LDYWEAADLAVMSLVKTGERIVRHAGFPQALNTATAQVLLRRLLGVEQAHLKIQSESFLKDMMGLDNNCTLIDVGAGTGSWSLWACPKARLVVALEPNSSAFVWLARNTKKWKNIVRFQAAAWSNEGVIESFVKFGVGYTSYTSREAANNAEMKPKLIRAVTLDGLARRLGLDPDLVVVKVDVEGAEVQVLQGARELLSRARTVIVEAHEPRMDVEVEEASQILTSSGYQVQIVESKERPENKWVVAKRHSVTMPSTQSIVG